MKSSIAYLPQMMVSLLRRGRVCKSIQVSEDLRNVEICLSSSPSYS